MSRPPDLIEKAMRETLAIYVQGAPAASISFGATVTIICTSVVSAARWMETCPNGVLPESRVDVQIVCVPAVYGVAS